MTRSRSRGPSLPPPTAFSTGRGGAGNIRGDSQSFDIQEEEDERRKFSTDSSQLVFLSIFLRSHAQ